MRSWSALWLLFVRQLRTRGRIAALVLLCAGFLLVGWLVGRSDGDRSTSDVIDLIEQVGFALVVPLVTMLFATSTLGGLRDDKTLVHVWLTPTPAWIPATAAWAATTTVAAPILVPVTAGAAALAGADTTVVLAVAVTSLATTIAYAAVFTLLGMVLRRALVWGIVYILFWEGFIAGVGSSAAALSVRAHGSAALRGLSDVESSLLDGRPEVALVVLVAATMAAVALTAVTYRGQTVD